MQEKALRPYFLYGLLLGALVLAFYILKPFLGALVLAAIFAVVLQPIYSRLAARLGGRSSIASVLTILIFAVVILIPASFIGSQLVFEAQNMYASLSEEGTASAGDVARELVGSVAEYIPGGEERAATISANIDTYARSALNWLIQHVGPAFSGVLTFILDTFIFFIALYYLLRDGRALVDKVIHLSPLSDRDDSVIIAKLEVAVNSVIKGQLAIALVQGILTGIGLSLFGVPNAVLWGVVASIAALIPSVGTGLVLVPAVAYLAVTGSVAPAIGLAVWAALAVGLVDNLLGPRLISNGLQLHPLLVILAIIGGILLFGPIGIFLGPLTMSFLMVLLSIYKEMGQRTEPVSGTVIQ